jgi:hypothetical protein
MQWTFDALAIAATAALAAGALYLLLRRPARKT